MSWSCDTARAKPSRAVPRLSDRDAGGRPESLLRYIARFDRREFWLAHEELEGLWLADRQDFFKGLIQFAAAFVHIERGNWRGARRLLRTGLEYTAGSPERHYGFDVVSLRERVTGVLGEVERRAVADAEASDEPLFFELQPLFDGELPADPADLVDDETLPYRVRRYEQGYRPYRTQKDR